MKKVLALIFAVVMLAGGVVGAKAGCPEIVPDEVYYDSHGAEIIEFEKTWFKPEKAVLVYVDR